MGGTAPPLRPRCCDHFRETGRNQEERTRFGNKRRHVRRDLVDEVRVGRASQEDLTLFTVVKLAERPWHQREAVVAKWVLIRGIEEGQFERFSAGRTAILPPCSNRGRV